MILLVFPMDFSLYSLRIFVEVSTRQGFSSAAKFLALSQGAVSLQIQGLEQSLGVKLIDRSDRPLKLTEAGRIFLQFAKETINKSYSIGVYLKELSEGVAGEVRVGATTSLGSYLLPAILGDILTKNPKLRINLIIENRTSVCQSVRESQVDFGFILSDELPQGLRAKVLRKESLCFIVGPKHPLAKKRSVTVKDLEATPFAVGSINYEFTEMVDKLLRVQGLSNYPIGCKISNFEGRKECVRAGVGVSILPHCTVLNEISSGSLLRLRVRGIHLSASIMLVENGRRFSSPSVNLVRELISNRLQKIRP